MTNHDLKNEILAHLKLETEPKSFNTIAEELIIDDKEWLRATLTELKTDGYIRLNQMKYTITDAGIEMLDFSSLEIEEVAPVELPPNAVPTDAQREQLKDDIQQEHQQCTNYLIQCGADTVVIQGYQNAYEVAREYAITTGHNVEFFELKQIKLGEFAPRVTAVFQAEAA